MNVLWCLAALSVVGFFVSLWFRDRERRSLCRIADAFMRESDAREAWLATYEKTLHSTAQMARVAILTKSKDLLPNPIRDHLRRYYRVRVLPVLFLIVMVAVGLIANAKGGS
jgi:hypothetical protein